MFEDCPPPIDANCCCKLLINIEDADAFGN